MESKKMAMLAAALAFSMVVPALHAGGIVTLESDEQAHVYLDSEEVGTTPLTLSNIEPGYHTIRLENPRTGQIRDYNFYSPRKTTVQKSFTTVFANEPPAPARAGTPVYVQQPVAVQAPPPVERKDNSKARMRNVALGAGLVNEVFNKGSSKSGIRKGVVGAGLLNELLNK